jgi:hypothetical protein
MIETEKDIKNVVDELYWTAGAVSPQNKVKKKFETVSWLVADQGWWTVRNLTVSLYSKRCVRFTNHGWHRIPKSLWPFQLPADDGATSFEITAHDTELSRPFFELLMRAVIDPSKEFKAPHFVGGKCTPSYAWTIKASEQYERNQNPRTK